MAIQKIKLDLGTVYQKEITSGKLRTFENEAA